MRRIGLVVLFITILCGLPTAETVTNPFAASSTKGEPPVQTTTVADNPSDFYGTGSPQGVLLSGLCSSGGTSTLDLSNPAYYAVNAPNGWTPQYLGTDLKSISQWVDGGIVNPKLDTYHTERWLGFGYNGEDVHVPDGWTAVKVEPGSPHLNHGIFELRDTTGGYDGTTGWRLDAHWYVSDTLSPDYEVYLSQQVSAPWRVVYMAEVSLKYYVLSASALQNQTHLFVRLEDHVSKLNVFEAGDLTNTWIEATVQVPTSYLEGMVFPGSLLLDIGLGTDLSGQQASERESQVLIDEIGLRLNIRPFPEQIGLKANGVSVVGSTSGSISPYVPDNVNRDCYSAPDRGIDLNGHADNGILEVGADAPNYPDWSTAYAYQVGMQFQLSIPRGAAITSATLEVEAEAGASNLPSMRIYVADEDTVTPFTGGYPVLRARYDWVNTSIIWAPTAWSAGARYVSPDIAPILQRVVSRPGWQSGSYICVMLDYAYGAQDYAYNNVKGSSNYPQADLARVYVNYRTPLPEDTVRTLKYYKTVTIDHLRVAADLTNYPMLLDIWDSDLHTKVQSDGDDIGFMLGVRTLNHEVELFDQTGNGTHAHLVAWVNVPELSSTRDTQIVMLYGNPQVGPQEVAESVWDSDFAGVWHLSENPTGAVYDSTANNNDGTGQPGGSVPGLVVGKFDSCIELYGDSSRRIQIPDANTLDLPYDISVEAWVRSTNADATADTILAKWGAFNDRNYWLGKLSGTQIAFFVDGPQNVRTSYGLIDDGNWHHVVGVADAASYTLLIYVDGVLRNSTLYSGSSRIGTGLLDFGNNPDSLIQEWPGRIDEVRISGVVRTQNWIRTQYGNLQNPDTFYSVGDEGENLSLKYKKDITIDNTKVYQDVTNFPLLIDVYDRDLRTDVQPDGDDIAFVQSGKKLDHQIELFQQAYNSTHAHLVAWVKATLYDLSTSIISMYYGNPHTRSHQYPYGLWDSSYAGVWHLGESAGNALDSSLYGTQGVVSAGVARAVTGRIGLGYDFNGANGNVNFGDPSDGHLDFGTSSFTFSLWVRVDQSTGNYQLPIYKGGTSATEAGYECETNTVATGLVGHISDGASAVISDATSITLGQWMYLVEVVDRTANQLRFYKNGALVGTAKGIGAIGSVSNTRSFQLSPTSYPVDGRIDEARVRRAPLSAGWVATEYANQNSPSTFYSVSAEVLVTQHFMWQKDIVVDHRKVLSDLVNFPVLVELYDRDLSTDVQSDGDDIAFRLGDLILDHEIETFTQNYNATHARLVAWVRVPLLSSSQDAIITMVYGNGAIGSQQNSKGVWASRYAGVWHLSETSGSTLDSTTYATSGTLSGGIGRGVAGIVGGAYDFNGVDGTVTFGDPADGHLDFGTSSFSYSMWVRIDGTTGNTQRPLYKGGSSTTDRGYDLQTATDGLSINAYTSDGTISRTATSTGTPFSSWVYLTAVVNRATGRLLLFKNGVETGSGSSISTLGSVSSTTAFRISGVAPYQFNGAVDEVRLSRFAYSAEWINTEYVNQKNPAAFYSVGDESPYEADAQSIGVGFTTSSAGPIVLDVTLLANVTTTKESLANDLSPGTSFTVSNSTLTEWTANVFVSAPPELHDLSFAVSYPVGEWVPVSVTNPIGVIKTNPEHWKQHAGLVVISASALDAYGVWKVVFQDRNQLTDLEMRVSGGSFSDTADFSIGDYVEFRSWGSAAGTSYVALTLVDPAGSVWYSGAADFEGNAFVLPYSYRKYITIDHTKVASDLSGFPVLVDLYDRDLRTDVRSDGSDIAFAVGDTVLAHEIELFDQTYNATHAHLIAWVRVPTLSSSVDTTIAMYYHSTSTLDTSLPSDVWDMGYLGVWHLSETGSGAVDEYKDSSYYGNHGRGGEGDLLYVPHQTSGKIGTAQDFNNVDSKYDLIDCGDSPLFDITGTQITLQAWIKHGIVPPYTSHVYGIMTHKGWYDGYSLWIDQLGIKPTFNAPGDTDQLKGATDITPSIWHYVVATYDGSYMRIYVDGVQDLNVRAKVTNLEATTSEKGYWIGHGDQPKDRGWSGEWVGQIDEVRLSTVARPAGWVLTEYRNQNNPGSFFSVSSEASTGYAESSLLELNSSAPQGQWFAVARYFDNMSSTIHRAGIYVRPFIVKHQSSLALQAPVDAVSDHLTSLKVGSELFVKLRLLDTSSSLPVDGATVEMNWTTGGSPSSLPLNGLGNGCYGRTVNTSDLGSAGRWRLEFHSYHMFYSNSTDYLLVDLCHESYLTFVTPGATPYGDDFVAKVTLRDSFDGSFLAGASFSSNGTIVNPPVDYGNGSYLVTFDGSGYGIGEHVLSVVAIPSTPFVLTSSADVTFTCRAIKTQAYSVSSTTVNVPWGQNSSVLLQWNDSDHGSAGIVGGTVSCTPVAVLQVTDLGNGLYSVTADTSSLSMGTHYLEFSVSRPNYKTATTVFAVTVTQHRTSAAAYTSDATPVGMDTYLTVIFTDLDIESAPISTGNLSQIVADWGTGSSVHPGYTFWLDTDGWAVGLHALNITIRATSSPRYYDDASILLLIDVRRLDVSLTWDHIDSIPNGDDFVMNVHVNVSEPDTPLDGTPINNLPDSYFSATDGNALPYVLKNIEWMGDGRYSLTIDSAYFSEGDYTIILYLDFPVSDNWSDTETSAIVFSYRPIRTSLSSSDYPKVTTTYGTNATVMLHYFDLDRGFNITTGFVISEGAPIDWLYTGNGMYSVSVDVSGWDLGSHYVNLTADASGYSAKTLRFEILVQIAYAYARPSATSFDMPLGTTVTFHVDYWDIVHDEVIVGANVGHNWTHSLSVTWTGAQYRLQLTSYDTDVLGNCLVLFNFSKGSNYQFGYFNITLSLRTHNTEFRLASAVSPTSYQGTANISVYYGDLDSSTGIASSQVHAYVTNATGEIPVLSFTNDTSLGSGYYILRVLASRFGGTGIFHFTVFFNWTGPGPKFYNGTAAASVSIVGEDSRITLIDSAGPTPFSENMSYFYRYSETYSGNGISNATTGNVFLYVEFLGVSVDSSQMILEEWDPLGHPGEYRVEFNSTILGIPGVYTMVVHLNWSSGVAPYYPNRTSSIQVRVLARYTTLSVTPPQTTPYGVNATFSFSFDDVSGTAPVRIPTGPQISIILSLADYSILYDADSLSYTVSFNTSVLGASLGTKSFTITLVWIGSPYFANVTDHSVLVTVRFRETSLDYQTPAPTPYRNNVTFVVMYTDITGGSAVGIDDATVSLYYQTFLIPQTFYEVLYTGGGAYGICLNTTYFGNPGSFSLTVHLTTARFYYATISASRTLAVRYRLTVLTAQPLASTPYNSSIEILLQYRDMLTLLPVGNDSQPVTLQMLNGTSWLFTSTWRQTYGDYLVRVETYNHVLEVGRIYVLWLRMSYPHASPFFGSADAYVIFQVRIRASSLELLDPPLSTPYLESINFTVLYRDVDLSAGISGATILLYKGLTQMTQGTDYIVVAIGDGRYRMSVSSVALGALGVSSVTVRSVWIGSPYHDNASLAMGLTVIQRSADVAIVVPPSQAAYLDNVTFLFRYVDTATGLAVIFNEGCVSVWSGLNRLLPGEFIIAGIGADYAISINSTVLGPGLVADWNLTVVVDWDGFVAPYYTDDQISTRITTTHRVGIVTLGPAPTVSVGDNLTLTLTFEDETTGLGIGESIVEFDCLNPSGLIEGLDYWVARGSGAETGNLTIIVSSSSLGSAGLYTFRLRLTWPESLAPFYQNTSIFNPTAQVRLIQVLLTNDIPIPSTVPLRSNVTILLTLTDLDHEVPIQDAATAFSVKYKSTGLPPAAWTIEHVSGAVYRLVVNCSDAGALGTNVLIVFFAKSTYQATQVQIPFQVRLRTGAFLFDSPAEVIVGDQTHVIVKLVDVDAGNALLASGSLTPVWPGIVSWADLGDGSYNITLSTSGLIAGVSTLVLGGNLPDYFTADVSISITILPIPAHLSVVYCSADVYWGDNVTIRVFYNDSLHNIGITDAVATFQFGLLSGSLLMESGGNYSFTLDTGRLAQATSYLVSITAMKNNHLTVTEQLLVNVLELPSNMTIIDALDSQDLYQGDPVNVTVYLEDTINGLPLTGAMIIAQWAGLSGQTTILGIPGKPGFYSGYVSTYSRNVGTHTLNLRVQKDNYLADFATIYVTIRQIPSVVWLDGPTLTYRTMQFNWSTVIRLGVYVLVPTLNLSDPYSTGLSECTVTWFLSGTNATGVFENGFTIGGPGYFYCDFESEEYLASIYVLRVTATPDDKRYAASSNQTLLSVVPVMTSVAIEYVPPRTWGWCGSVLFNYTDEFHNSGVEYASASVEWAGARGQITYLGYGSYSLLLNTSFVHPGVYPVIVTFQKENFRDAYGVLTLTVLPIPTEAAVYSPHDNQQHDDPTALIVPFGDTIDIVFFYNDTEYLRGIEGASVLQAVLTGPYITDKVAIAMTELQGGNYTLSLDTSQWHVSDIRYRLVVFLGLENRTSCRVEIYLTIIKVPTELTIDGPSSLVMGYGQLIEIRLFYRDTWPTHGLAGIGGAAVNVTSLNEFLVVVHSAAPDSSRGIGWYVVTLASLRNQGSAAVVVELSKTNFVAASASIAISVEPSPMDVLLERIFIFGGSAGIAVLVGAALWLRVFSVPKRVRQMDKMVKVLKRGKVPRIPENIQTRPELIAELFNETWAALGIERSASQMQDVTIKVGVPEIEELVVQLSILTKPTPKELADFRNDLSKMRLSEQVTFVKEVINQEAIRTARAQGKKMEEVLQETRTQAQSILGGGATEEIHAVSEPEPIIIESPAREAKPEVEKPPLEVLEDKLAEYEIMDLRQRLIQSGMPKHEVETIIEQTRALPRDLVSELIDSILRKEKGGGKK